MVSTESINKNKIEFDGILLDSKYQPLVDDLRRKGISTQDQIRNTALAEYTKNKYQDQPDYLHDLRVCIAKTSDSISHNKKWDDAIGYRIPIQSFTTKDFILSKSNSLKIKTLFELFSLSENELNRQFADSQDFCEDVADTKRMPVAALSIPEKVVNILTCNGIMTVGKLTMTGSGYLSQLPGMNSESLSWIESALTKLPEELVNYRRITNKPIKLKSPDSAPISVDTPLAAKDIPALSTTQTSAQEFETKNSETEIPGPGSQYEIENVSQVGDKLMSDLRLNSIIEEIFWNWLSPKVSPNQLSEYYRYAQMLNDYFVPNHHFSGSVLNEMIQKNASVVRRVILQDVYFLKKINKYDQNYISNLLRYMETFISENKSQLQPECLEQKQYDKVRSQNNEGSKENSLADRKSNAGKNDDKDTDGVSAYVEKMFVKQNLIQYLQEQTYPTYLIYVIPSRVSQLEDIARQLNAPSKKIYNVDVKKSNTTVNYLKYKIRGTNWDKPAYRETIEILLKYFIHMECQGDPSKNRPRETEVIARPVSSDVPNQTAVVPAETVKQDSRKAHSDSSAIQTAKDETVKEEKTNSEITSAAENQPVPSDEIRNAFITFMREQVSWQIDQLLSSLEKLEKNVGKERLFSPDIEEASRSLKLLRYQQKYKDPNRTDKRVMDLLEKFISQQKHNPDLPQYRTTGAENGNTAAVSVPMQTVENIPEEHKTEPDALPNKPEPSLPDDSGIDTPYEIVDFNNLEFYSFCQPVSVRYYGKKLEINSWRSLYGMICNALLLEHPDVFEVLRNESQSGTGGLRLVDAEHKGKIIVAYPLGSGYFIEVNRSATDLIRNLKYILDRCEVDYDNVVIEYIRKETKDETVEGIETTVVSSQDDTSIRHTDTSINANFENDISSGKDKKLKPTVELFREFFRNQEMGEYTESYLELFKELEKIARQESRQGIYQLFDCDPQISSETMNYLMLNRVGSTWNTPRNRAALAWFDKFLNYLQRTKDDSVDDCNSPVLNKQSFSEIVNQTESSIEKTERKASNLLEETIKEDKVFLKQKIADLEPITEKESIPEPNQTKETVSVQTVTETSDAPTSQPRWTLQEAAVLLDAYLKVREHPERRKELVQQVSDQLRQMAVNQGMEISDTYRNYYGINLRMYSMETSWTGRNDNHFASTKVFSQVTELYRTDKNNFDKLLREAQNLSEKTKSENSQMLITKQDFRNYLKGKGHSTFQQASFGVALSTMESKFDVKLFDQSIERCQKAVFFLKDALSAPIYRTPDREKALNALSEYLSELSNTLTKSDIRSNLVHETEWIVPVDTSEEWILAYLKAKNIQYLDNRAKNGCLWLLGGHELDPYIRECKAYGYKMYYKPDGCKTFPDKEVWWTTSGVQITSVIPTQKPTSVVPDNKQQYRDILAEYFKTGYMPGIMSRKRFKKYWLEKNQEEVPDNDSELELIIQEICIEGGGRYFVPEAMMDDVQKAQLMDYLQKRRNAGDKAVAWQVVFDDLSEMFVDTEISTPEMLRTWLRREAKEQFRFEKDFVLLQTGTLFDPEKEIKKYLHDARVPVHFDQICRDLSHIPADKIKNILNFNTPSLLYNAGNEWFNAEILDLTPEDFSKIRSLIDKNLNEQEYVLVKELYSDLCTIHPDISDQLAVLSMYGLQNYLKYKLSGSYAFNGQIISSYARTIDTAKIYQYFARRNVPFTYEDLRDLSKDLNTIIYYESTFDSCIRINAKDYVSRERVHFDIERTDEVLDRFISGSYIPLKEFHSFDLLPGCESPWNIFLLEQYVYQFSRSFRLCHAGFSADICAGAIVRSSSQIHDFKNDLVPLALADTNVPLAKNDILNYLAESGLIARKNMDITEEMLRKSKVLRAQKGKN